MEAAERAGFAPGVAAGEPQSGAGVCDGSAGLQGGLALGIPGAWSGPGIQVGECISLWEMESQHSVPLRSLAGCSGHTGGGV